MGRAVAKRDAPWVGRLPRDGLWGGRLPWDGHARTVHSPQHQLRGERLWDQACRGSADSCETGRTIGRALAKERRPRRPLRAAAARASTRAAAPYARQTRWLQRACAVCWCGASSRKRGRRPRACAAPLGAGWRWCAACRSRRGAVGLNVKHAWTTHLLQPSARKTLRALNRGKIHTPCMIRGVSAAKRAPPWQDMRVVYPPAAICSAFRMHGAHFLPMPARFGCMAAICCQGGALFPSGGPSGMHGAKRLPCWTSENA